MSSIRLLIDNTNGADLALAEYAKVHQKINNLQAAGLGVPGVLREQEQALAQYSESFQPNVSF